LDIQVLGCHQGEASDYKLVCFLVDGVLAIDAGSLTATLSLADQEKVRAILLTHHHLDHVKDLPIFGFNVRERSQVQVFATTECREAVCSRLLDGAIWPDLTRVPSPEKPVFQFQTVEPGRAFQVEGYRVVPIAVNHKVTTVGYDIQSPDGRRFFYSGDTGPGLDDVWRRISPDVVAIDVTLPNRMESAAVDAGHLTPSLLESELMGFLRIQGLQDQVPRVVAVHINPYFEDEIRTEIAAIAKRLRAEVLLAHEGLTISL
jgi:ribonuclease BN (tRNA processing enzyme)